MGLILCTKHGPSGVRACCAHVAAAVAGASERIRFEEISLDFEGKQPTELKHLFCVTCMKKFDFSSRMPVPESVWTDESAMPRSSSVCGNCLAEFDQKGRGSET